MYDNLRAELEAIASEELAEILDHWPRYPRKWPTWTAPQRAELVAYLTDEMSPGGLLSVDHGHESGNALAAVRREARAVIRRWREAARRAAPCTCRGYDPADPCGHGDTSEGCPKHGRMSDEELAEHITEEER